MRHEPATVLSQISSLSPTPCFVESTGHCIVIKHTSSQYHTCRSMPGCAIQQPGMCLCSEVAGARVAPPFRRKFCFTGTLHSPLFHIIFLLNDYVDDKHHHHHHHHHQDDETVHEDGDEIADLYDDVAGDSKERRKRWRGHDDDDGDVDVTTDYDDATDVNCCDCAVLLT